MHVVASNNKGENKIINFANSKKFSWLSALEINKEPKNILPESPMKILAGYQLNNIKAKSDAIDIRKVKFPLIETIKNTLIKHPPTKPSIPSMKFIKLIIAVPANIHKMITRKLIK